MNEPAAVSERREPGDPAIRERAASAGVTIASDTIESVVGSQLVLAQWRELLERYGVPDADPDGLTALHLAPPDGEFLVAWADRTAVGCGGLRRYDATTGEIKRMYVVPAWRRRGVSRAILLALEARAREIGYVRLVLETGTRQPEAMALYESECYTPIESYGSYRDAPQSRCYAKDLA
ncbi:MAG: N-acetyltransferase [Acidimicrobiia bacterium]